MAQSPDDIITEVLLAGEEAKVWADDLAPAKEECCVCIDQVETARILPLPCSSQHWACFDCLPTFFERALACELDFPPRCCDKVVELQMKDFDHVLSRHHPQLVAQYRAKEDEYRTFLPFRRYCANEACRTFLSTESYRYDEQKTLAQCPSCETTTCIRCESAISKVSIHTCEISITEPNVDYNTSDNRQKFCPYCGKAIVLGSGCNHITCHCKNEWCFICLQPWKNVDGASGHRCPLYNDVENSQYDIDGFGQDGFHRISQLDRKGFNRDGVNIEGKNKNGQIIKDFAKRKSAHVRRLHDHRALREVDGVNFEDHAMLVFVHELDHGMNHATDVLHELKQQRFGNPDEANRANNAGINFDAWLLLPHIPAMPVEVRDLLAIEQRALGRGIAEHVGEHLGHQFAAPEQGRVAQNQEGLLGVGAAGAERVLQRADQPLVWQNANWDNLAELRWLGIHPLIGWPVWEEPMALANDEQQMNQDVEVETTDEDNGDDDAMPQLEDPQ